MTTKRRCGSSTASTARRCSTRSAASPAEEITDFADEEGMDAIVMGSAYRGTIGTILGGTADRVVRTSHVPVITQRMHMDDI